jgi:chromosome segregation ATPase
MAVVCCATPSELYLEETRSTLLFASRAKLVKTNAQVNEVLDDRSIIRRLQRELAEARRYGGGAAQTEHVKALEDRATTAGTAAKEAGDKLKRLYESILNNDGTLFGDKKPSSARPNKRRHRLSEGNLLIGQTTPSRSNMKDAAPTTLPRPVKAAPVVVAKSLSPASELTLLRQAVTAKSLSVVNLKKHVDDVSRQLQLKESELLAVNCSNDLLRSDRDQASEQSAGLMSDIAALRSELEAATASQEALLNEKDEEISRYLLKLEQEVEDRRVLEETVDALQEDKGSLEHIMVTMRESTDAEIASLRLELETKKTQFESQSSANQELRMANDMHVNSIDDLQQQLAVLRDDNAQTAAQKDAEITALLRELATKNEEFQQLNNKMEVMAMELGTTQAQQESALMQVGILGETLKTATSALEALKEANGELESKLELAGKKANDVNEQLDMTKTELSNTKTTIEELEVELKEITILYENGEASLHSYRSDLESAQQLGLTMQSDLEQALDEKRQLEEHMAALALRNDAAEAELSQLKDDLGCLESHIGSLKVEIEGLETKSDDLASKVVDVEKERDALATSLDTTSASLRATETEIEAMSASRDSLKADNQELRETLASTIEDRDLVNIELHDIRQALVGAQSTIQQLSASIAALETDKTTLESTVQDFVKERDVLVKQKAVLDTNLSQIEAQIIDLELQAKEVEQQLCTVTVERDEARTETARSVEVIGVAQIMYDGLVVALGHLESEKEKLATELTSVRDEKNAAEARADQTDATLNKLEPQLASLSAERDAVTNAASNMNISLETAQVKLEGLAVVLSHFGSINDNLALETAHLREHTTASVACIERLEGELDGRTADLEAQLSVVTAEKESAVNERATLLESLEAAHAKLDGLMNILSQSESDKENLAAEVYNLKENNAVAIARVKDLDGQLDDRSKEFEARLAAVIDERDEVMEEISRSSESIVAARTKIEGLTVALSHLESQLATASGERDSVRLQLESTTAKENAAQNAIAWLSASIETLQSDKERLSMELQTRSEERDAAYARVKEVDERLEKQDEDIESLQRKCEHLGRELTSAIAEREFLLQAKEVAEEHAEEPTADLFEREGSMLELEAMRETKYRLEAQIETQKAAENELASKLHEALVKLESVSREKTSLESKLLNESRELKITRDELLCVHDIIESSNARFNDVKQRMNDLEDELESKETMLSQSLSMLEGERDQLASDLAEARSELRDLTRQLGDLTAEKEELQANPVEIELIRSENTELKLLLVNSNRSIEEAREAAITATLEVEENKQMLEQSYQRLAILEDELSEALTKASNVPHSENIQNELQKALEAKSNSDKLLEGERADRKRSEDDLKRQMSEEQRALIREAEQTMQVLRSELAVLEQASKRSAAEAYAAREMKEELDDQNRRTQEQVLQLESKVAALENENTRLRRSSNRQDNERDSELATLKASLQQAKADRRETQAALRDLETKLDITKNEKESAEHNLSVALEKLNAILARGLEDENRRLTMELTKLKQDIASARTDIKENALSAKGERDLRAQIDQLQETLQTKDDRIKKLEKCKLTKDKINAIQKLKVRALSFVGNHMEFPNSMDSHLLALM